MAWTYASLAAGNADKTANQASHAFNAAEYDSLTPGTVVVATIAVDNSATTDGDEGAVSALSDDAGNTYTKAIEFCNSQGAAGAGCTISVWYCQITNETLVSTTLTATFTNSAARDASALSFAVFNVASGSTVSVAGTASIATDNADPDDITLGSLASSQYLWWWAMAAEGPYTDAYTLDADYTTNLLTGAEHGTSGGGAASNIHQRIGYRIATLTTDTVTTTATTATRDYAQVLVAFKENVAVTTKAPPPFQKRLRTFTTRRII